MARGCERSSAACERLTRRNATTAAASTRSAPRWARRVARLRHCYDSTSSFCTSRCNSTATSYSGRAAPPPRLATTSPTTAQRSKTSRGGGASTTMLRFMGTRKSSWEADAALHRPRPPASPLVDSSAQQHLVAALAPDAHPVLAAFDQWVAPGHRAAAGRQTVTVRRSAAIRYRLRHLPKNQGAPPVLAATGWRRAHVPPVQAPPAHVAAHAPPAAYRHVRQLLSPQHLFLGLPLQPPPQQHTQQHLPPRRACQLQHPLSCRIKRRLPSSQRIQTPQ